MRLFFELYSLFFLFITHSRSSDLDYSSDLGNCPCEIEIYEADQPHGIIKSPNYPRFEGCEGRCIYKILPHPNKSVSLYTTQYSISRYASIIVYSLLIENGEEIRIAHAKIQRPSGYYYSSFDDQFPGFVSAKNAGFELHFVTHTSAYFTSFKMSFDRYYEEDEVCDYPIVKIGSDETIVQRPHPFHSATGCVYLLVPSEASEDEEAEMLIRIEKTNDGEVKIREQGGTGNFGEPLVGSRLVSAHNVQVLSTKARGRDELYKMPKITAKLIQNKCQCPSTNYQIDNNQTFVSVQSPGYPHLFCPRKKCAVEILTGSDTEYEDMIGILEITCNATIGVGDTFSLQSAKKRYIDVSYYKTKAVSLYEKFVIKQQPLMIKYESDHQYVKRFFELEVDLVLINPECSCNFFKEKEIKKDMHFEATFPAYCTYIYCNFQFKAYYTYKSKIRALLDFQVEGAIDGDVVIIKDEKHAEKYEGDMLDGFRRFEVVYDSDFAFYRDSFNAYIPTRLIFNYTKLEEDGDCQEEPILFSVDPEDSLIITSPNYPHFYGNDLKCQYIISVPENCRMTVSIDEVSVENFHDFVRIYEGNSTTGKLLKSITSQVHHQVLNITTKTVLIVFLTDQSITDRGFHITVKARVVPDDPSMGYGTWTVIGIVGIILIILCLLIIYTRPWIQKRRDQNKTEQQPKPPQEEEPTNLFAD